MQLAAAGSFGDGQSVDGDEQVIQFTEFLVWGC